MPLITSLLGRLLLGQSKLGSGESVLPSFQQTSSELGTLQLGGCGLGDLVSVPLDTTQQTINSQACIQNYTSKTVTSQGSIAIHTTKTITAQAEIVYTSYFKLDGGAVQTTAGALSGGAVQTFFENTNRKFITSQGNISAYTAKTISAQADIKNYTTKTFTSQARIQQTYNQRITSQASITPYTLKYVTAQGSIHGTTVQTITSQGSISNIFNLRLDGGAVQSPGNLLCGGAVQNFSGTLRVIDITAQANILGYTSKTITSQGRIAGTPGTTVQTITSQGSIQRYTKHSITSMALIGYEQTITSQGSIRVKTSKDIVAAGCIANTTTQTITSIAHIYPYKDKTINALGCIQAYTTKTVTSQASIAAETAPPTAPGSLSASGVGSVTLVWTASTDAVAVTEYDIYRAPAGTTSWVFIGSVPGTVLTFTDFPGPGAWIYYVVARNAFGQTSSPSNTVTITIAFGTTTQTISSQANINGTTLQTITSQGLILTTTPAVGLKITQAVQQVSETRKVNIKITQAVQQVSETRKVNMKITQAVRQVLMIDLGTGNKSRTGLPNVGHGG